MSDTVLCERAGSVATITINRPEKLNALDASLLQELARVVQALRDDADSVRAVVMTGVGKAFVAGADISAMAEIGVNEAKRLSETGHRLCANIEATPFPFIAAVNGFALGGGLELALACDFIYAATSAKLGLPEVTLGVIPGFGGTQRLARRVGRPLARELIYTGGRISAEEALRIRLVNKVCPDETLLAQAQETAQRIASLAPLAIAAAKRVIGCGKDVALPVACELEAQAFAGLFGSEDQRAGMRAFLSKTKVAFKGR